MSELLVSIENGIAILTINRPAVYNALNKNVLDNLAEFCHSNKDNSEIYAAIITGAGEKSFAAGADIAEMRGLSSAQAQAHAKKGQDVLALFSTLSFPIIAAVNGVALGGGLELALACDFIYASENASLGLVETSLGLIPGFGGHARLARRVGTAWAAELIFSARKIDAQTALRIGLLNQVCKEGEVLAHALTCAEMIAKQGPYAVSTAKKLLYAAQDLSESEAHAAEQQSFGQVFAHVNHQEGIAAFFEKRKAQFSRR